MKSSNVGVLRVLLLSSLMVLMLITSILLIPFAPASPDLDDVGVKELKYILLKVPGELSDSQTFVSGRCLQRFQALGIKSGVFQFELDLVPRRPEYYSYNASGNGIEINASKGLQPIWACASADNVTVDVRVVNKKGGDIIVNYTVRFADFKVAAKVPLASSAKYLGVLETLLGEPTLKRENTLVWVKNAFSISRLIAIKKDGEAVDLENGVWLGEWILWREPWRSSKPRLVLAGINYGFPYYYKGGSGFTAFLAYIPGESVSGIYRVEVNGREFEIDGQSTVVGFTVPLPFVGAEVPKAPSPSVEKLLGTFGCKLEKENKVKIICEKLLTTYNGVKSEKPWKLVVKEHAHGDSVWDIVEISYRGMRLAPHPLDVYRLVYWKEKGLLLYIGEEAALAGKVAGYAPPPLTGYIHGNGYAAVFVSLNSPLALRLVEARLSSGNNTIPATLGYREYLFPVVLLALAVASIIIVARRSVKH